MRDERVGSLTQGELVAEMRRRGCGDVTERQIADWRRKDLLPPFDVVGGGKGRRRGRARSLWSKGEPVLNQAMWVRELLQIYRSIESIRLPLWVLGYLIPLEYVREALHAPLAELADGIAEAVKDESRASGEIEDFIEEGVYHQVEKMRRAGVGALAMPQHSAEALFNLFFNQGYDLTDGAFELGAEELKEYEDAMLLRQATILAAGGLGDAHAPRQDTGLGSLFDRAPFIKQYFSLHELKRAIEECTDDDLWAVQRDLSLLREMAELAFKIITILGREVPEEYKPARADVLQSMLSVGGVLILVDLSLRRNGFAQAIDKLLPEALQDIQRRFTDEVERELIEASKKVPDTIEIYGPLIVNSLIQELKVGG